MFEFALIVGLWAGGEVARDAVAACESVQRDADLRAFWAWRHNHNQAYGAMEWAVPNSVLVDAAAYPVPPLAAFPQFPPGGSIPSGPGK
jgi:hypothetical protein